MTSQVSVESSADYERLREFLSVNGLLDDHAPVDATIELITDLLLRPQSMLGGSCLPMTTVDDEGEVNSVTVCSSIAGGYREIDGMPESLELSRWREDGMILAAIYKIDRGAS